MKNDKTMEWTGKCPKCDAELVYGQNESTLTWTCPKCGWGLATSYIPPIELDTSDYEILLLKNMSPGKSQLSTLSRLTGVNFIQGKKLLESDGFLLLKGKAVEIFPVKQQLEQEGIDFTLNPDFVY